jgi:hypothetical protein
MASGMGTQARPTRPQTRRRSRLLGDTILLTFGDGIGPREAGDVATVQPDFDIGGNGNNGERWLSLG